MVLLECSVQNCVNNNRNHCCLNEITVSGATTYQSENTNCENFINKSKALTNSISEGNPYTNINCRAKHCIYNKDFKCNADSIIVSGYTSETSEDTQCSNFSYKST
ncbi:MAG: DUF1540 domain-containing protein [Clostridium sp.]|uniref:DUF1540 domain-containing protein n=1 Tax=Clostridium sp. TaxID=1506 RepID=UPI002FC69BB5